MNTKSLSGLTKSTEHASKAQKCCRALPVYRRDLFETSIVYSGPSIGFDANLGAGNVL